MNRELRTLAAFLLLLPGAGAFGAPLTTGADFLLMTTGARPDGMGQAFSAVADDINTLSFNPAGLANIRLPEVGYGYERFPAGIDFNTLGAAIPMGGAGVLGLGYLGLGTAPFDSTGGGGPLVSALEQAFLLGWGVSLYDLHLGVSAKYILRDLDGFQGSGLGFDLGFRFRFLPTWTVAASVLNLGPGVSFPGSEEPLPTTAHLGTALTLVEEEGQHLDLALDAGWNTVTQVQTLGFGAEYGIEGTFFLRAGYLAGSRDQEFQLDGLSGGLGLRISFLQLDYSFQPFNTFGSIHRFSGLLRWEGSWMKGVEPNAPRYVSTRPTARGLEVRWEPPQGPSFGYQVVLQPLDGRPPLVSPRVTTPYYVFPALDPGTLYKASVRTLGEGGTKSYPSPEVLFKVRPTRKTIGPSEKGLGGVFPGTGGVQGELDAVGLRISFPDVADASGYKIYRQDPEGQVHKVTLSPRKTSPLWISDPSVWAGSTFLVTALLPGGQEKDLGGLTWEPTPSQTASLVRNTVLSFKASPQPGGKVFLDWGRSPGAAGYSLFIGREPDGILEKVKDYGPDRTTDYLRTGTGGGPKVDYLLAPQGPEGRYLQRSNLSQAEPFF